MAAFIKQQAAEAKEKGKQQKKNDWMKDYNEFDGLVHKNGKVYELDGTEVNRYSDSLIQTTGVEVADRNAEDDEDLENQQIKIHQKQQQRLKHMKELKREFNEFDGLIHTRDGRKFSPIDGKEVINED